MAIRRAVQIGEPSIRAKSVTAAGGAATKKIARDLIDSMRHYGLVGMAAPQIGVNKRIFVTEIRRTKTRNPRKEDSVRVFVNPRIVKISQKQAVDYEGCGSVAHAGLFGAVRRPFAVTVTASDLSGKRFTLKAGGLLARIIQHEADHLDGIVFLDRMKNMVSLMDREVLKRI